MPPHRVRGEEMIRTETGAGRRTEISWLVVSLARLRSGTPEPTAAAARVAA